MGVLGKDILDYTRPLTHVKVQFGSDKYWLEHNSRGQLYGSVLVDVLNFDVMSFSDILKSVQYAFERTEEMFTGLYQQALTLPLYCDYMNSVDQWESVRNYFDNDEKFLSFLEQTMTEIEEIQERYDWFIEEALDDGGQRRKRGQRKIPVAERIMDAGMDAFVSGRSLGRNPEVDAPNVQIQYAVLETEDGAEVVEKIYFDSLLDFVYVEFMKGLQKGFIPKRCPNCGKWFVQEPDMDFNYCANPSPQDPTKLCRDVGARSNFIEKKKNHGLWNIHQRAYRKYYARMKKGNMERDAFFAWAEEAATLRDELLPKYDAADYETRSDMEEKYRMEVNKL